MFWTLNFLIRSHLAAVDVAHQLVADGHAAGDLEKVAEVCVLQLHRELVVEQHERQFNLLELVALEDGQRDEDRVPNVPTDRLLLDVRHDSLNQVLGDESN